MCDIKNIPRVNLTLDFLPLDRLDIITDILKNE